MKDFTKEQQDCCHVFKQGYSAEDFCVYCVKCDLTFDSSIISKDER